MRTRRPLSIPYAHGLEGKPISLINGPEDVVEKVPWPSEGIRPGTIVEDYTWGYLYLMRTGEAEFDDAESPTNIEIMDRWGHYLEQAPT
jgi:hypothetical protein